MTSQLKSHIKLKAICSVSIYVLLTPQQQVSLHKRPLDVTVTCTDAPSAPEISSYNPMSSTDSCVNIHTHTHFQGLYLQ